MKGKQKIALCLVFLPLAIGLLAWWHWASQTVMRIKNYDTQHIYVEFPAKAGDRLFFGWIHSLEHIHWHEYFHIAPDHSLILVIEERGFFDGRFEESIHNQPYLGKFFQ